MLEKPPIRRGKPFTETDAMLPAERVQAADVEQLSRRSIGLAGIEAQHRVGMNDVAQALGKLSDRQILAGADVDVTELVVLVHEEHAGIRKIVDVEELTPRAARPPDGDFIPSLDLRVVKPSNQRRKHVR